MIYYPKLLSGHPIEVDGVIFYPYSIGIARTEWRTEDQRLGVARNPNAFSYYAKIDGKYLPTRFRSQANAMKAAIKALKFKS